MTRLQQGVVNTPPPAESTSILGGIVDAHVRQRDMRATNPAPADASGVGGEPVDADI